MLLAREAKGLLIGESADPELVRSIRATLEAHPAVTSVNHVRTIHSAPDIVFAAVSADFDDTLTLGRGEDLIKQVELGLKQAHPQLGSIYIRPEKQGDAVVVRPQDG